MAPTADMRTAVWRSQPETQVRPWALPRDSAPGRARIDVVQPDRM